MMDEAQIQPEQPAPGEDSGMQLNNQVRQMIMQIGALAQRIPEAQQELQVAAKALTAASLKLVASQSDQPQPTQTIGA